MQQEIVFKKRQGYAACDFKKCEDIKYSIKLEGNPMMLIYSKVCR